MMDHFKSLFRKNSRAPQTSEFIQKVTMMLEEYKSLYPEHCPYVLNERLSMSQVEQFESAAGITLPQDYRDFLIHIGNGAAKKRQIPLSLSHAKDCLESCLQEETGLECIGHAFSAESCNKAFHEDYEDMDEDMDDDAAKEHYNRLYREALQGTLTLHNDGCGYYIVMIVSGESAGQLYYIDTCHGQGIHKVSDSFADYYLKWLGRQILEKQASLEQNDKFDCVITEVKLGGNVRDLTVTKSESPYEFQFEFFCPGDFAREGDSTDLTQAHDRLVISLYMKYESYSPLEYKKLEGSFGPQSLQPDNSSDRPLQLIGARSEHIVIGQVRRLFKYNTGELSFPLYVEGLEQEILIQGLDIPDLAVGDVLQIQGRLCGEVYRIRR
ncbi:SMI1/KNR4 family protein SUKH-1 [Fontibacillus phaseoli]|uniref:SMI1/KNR4 family protein SUKH-1 n=1 Tax=Fontibacillus phaseoli TaxID=1416533 RepID=A0A369BGR6_9BACL|nr:SMI1/KNR4 family protein [Fontibacillus phaseoli]RCX20742.1 SMI1/KNR4 family protein SUKH-1 [Fontibacillus phaseoli]